MLLFERDIVASAFRCCGLLRGLKCVSPCYVMLLSSICFGHGVAKRASDLDVANPQVQIDRLQREMEVDPQRGSVFLSILAVVYCKMKNIYPYLF